MDVACLPSPAYSMADIGHKRATRRRAVAVGTLRIGRAAFARLRAGTLPKGDPLQLAEIAGIHGAKQASLLLPLCHPLPLERVSVRCVPLARAAAVRVWCDVACEARSGVEMEAIAGATAALLALYDLIKPVEPALRIDGVRLLFKEGGKHGTWLHPAGLDASEQATFRPAAAPTLRGRACAVITLSDRAASGQYPDRSGPVLVEGLRALDADVRAIDVIADDPALLQQRLRAYADRGIRLCLCNGGTGLGPRDHTPEALHAIADREVPGIGEMFRQLSAAHTSLAWLSRACAVQVGGLLAIALPGHPRAVAQGWDIVHPLLAHALAMIDGGTHP